jgi:hypothetical protein
MFEDWSNCIMTREQADAELCDIEAQLGIRLGITKDIRETLISLDKQGLLVEDSLVTDWQQAYASYRDYQENPDVK